MNDSIILRTILNRVRVRSRDFPMEARLNSLKGNQEVGERPERVPLRLLPFGPDRVSESFARTNLSIRT